MYLVLPCLKIACSSWGTLGAGAVLPKAETYTQHHPSLTRIAFHNISRKRWPRWPEKAIEKSLDTDDVVSTALIEGPGPGGQREGRHLRFCWCGDVEGRNLMSGLDWLRGVLSPCWRVWWNYCFDSLVRGFQPVLEVCSRGSSILDWNRLDRCIWSSVFRLSWRFELYRLYSLQMVARKRSRQANKKWDGWGWDARRLSETETCTIMNPFVPVLRCFRTSTSNTDIYL